MKNNYNACMHKFVMLSAMGMLIHIAPSQAASPVLSCNQLASFTVPADLIGMPTNGASVTSAQMMPASGSGAQAVGEYCKVYGDIHPIDPNAPNITFQLHLPTVWNQKSMMFGGGGYNGELDIFVNFVHAGPSNQLSPQGRGYAVFGSNAGHVQQPPFIFGRDASFGLNDESLRNFGSDALKKTRDTALTILQAYYGVAPQKAYFHGGSTGGREAITALQKWPQDYDGVIAIYPAIEFTGLLQQFGRISQALTQPGAYLNDAKRQLVHDAAVNACDHLDGVSDGLISNVNKCNQLFAPGNAGALGVLASLRCQLGVDTGNNCLSDTQIAMLRTIDTEIQLPFQMANGASSYPGFNIWAGADLGYSAGNQFLYTIYGLNSVAPAYPVGTDQAIFTVYFDQWMRYFVIGDASFNSVGLDSQALLAYQTRINTLSMIQNDRQADLSPFYAKGGKLLMLHGTSDVIISNRMTQQYYHRVVDAMGASVVANFVRYYEVPGYGHSVSADFNAGWDSVSALENWVENGQAPRNQVVEDKNLPTGTRTRPLCDYPNWPRYNGHGDVNQAASFHCVNN
jgi:Tannase and feruloyl esterase